MLPRIRIARYDQTKCKVFRAHSGQYLKMVDRNIRLCSVNAYSCWMDPYVMDELLIALAIQNSSSWAIERSSRTRPLACREDPCHHWHEAGQWGQQSLRKSFCLWFAFLKSTPDPAPGIHSCTASKASDVNSVYLGT